MLIGKKYKIESDPMNIILSKKSKLTNKQTGEPYEVWQSVGYYSSIASALKELVNLKVRETHLKDMNTIQSQIKELHTLIEQLPEALRHK